MGNAQARSNQSSEKKEKTKLYAFLDCDFDNEILLKRVRYSHSKIKTTQETKNACKD